MIHFDEHSFQMDWFKQKLDDSRRQQRANIKQMEIHGDPIGFHGFKFSRCFGHCFSPKLGEILNISNFD